MDAVSRQTLFDGLQASFDLGQFLVFQDVADDVVADQPPQPRVAAAHQGRQDLHRPGQALLQDARLEGAGFETATLRLCRTPGDNLAQGLVS